MNEVIEKCKKEKFKTIYEAFECFKENFLLNSKSIFTEKKVLNIDNLELIINSFDENPDETKKNEDGSKKSFDDKIKKQIGEGDDIKELFAHAIWLWGIFASDMRQESKVNEISNWLDNNTYTKESKFSFKEGIGSTGQYHKTNKPLELIYIIQFFKKVLENRDNENFDFIEIIKQPLKDNIEANEMYFGKNSNNSKKVSMYNILLHLFSPEKYARIASYGHKEKLVQFFEPILKLNDNDEYKEFDTDTKISKIEEKCREKFEKKYPYRWSGEYKELPFNADFDFYHEKIEKLWKNDIDFESKNLILHGAPGTGKTYVTEETIKTRKEVLENIEYELVQFHPSYGYEDFIEGIKPIGLKNGQMEFELKNGIFKQMCIDAFKNLIESQNDKTKLKTFYFIADEINRAELSRVFGELLLCLEDDKRLRIVKEKIDNKEVLKVKGTKIKTPNSNLWTKDDVVAFVDDNEQVRESLDNKKSWYFGVPENIYFIGTMNDIDRSVDSFDMALRRRFVWKHYRCDYEAIENKYKNENNFEKYIEVCKSLNNHIINEKGFNLSDSYELGQAYFMKPKNLTKKELDRVWLENISPILKEYLRAEYNEKDIFGKIEEARKKFILTKENNSDTNS
ncbi:McrB family protein [Aliarcobacter butzleri]|uniref:McrB family protein n=1 Tax=Aliarcobacter butzleri TaxID=28197 RepID=UPI001EDBA23B|nr:AAA family ATPase [Aliarcobacter butzleri]MCG3660022.1 AAA family ATPase [Aliarcobacter butzleri]